MCVHGYVCVRGGWGRGETGVHAEESQDLCKILSTIDLRVSVHADPLTAWTYFSVTLKVGKN